MPSSSLAILDSLPSYLGGKRQLAPNIFAAIAQAGYAPAQGHVLVDAFAGGCSVSLLGKALGYRVIANDIAERSEATGLALIVNDREHLTAEDVADALDHSANGRYRPSPKLLPFTDDVRDLLIGLADYAETFHSPAKRALMRTLTVKATVRIAMWGQLRSEGNRRIREGRYDRLTPGQATWLRTASRPRKQIVNEWRLLDRGVFANGLRNEMHRGDVIEFLQRTPGDVVYLDPPYPGTSNYEDEYAGVDELIQGHAIDVVPSRFSARDGWRFIGDVLAAADHIPCVVLSLGNESVEIDPLADMMRDTGREVTATSLRYVHLRSQSSAAKRDANEEFILVGQRPT